METIINRIRREYSGKDILDSEREEKERFDTMGAWMRVAIKRKKGLSKREEMNLNI